MLPLQNGSDLSPQTCVFSIEDQSQVGEARRFAASLCVKLKFDDIRLGRVSIVVNELGANLVKYSTVGKLLFRVLGSDPYGFEIIAIDKGPGILNSAEAMRDGFSTGSSPGTGLGAVKRQSDEFDIFSALGSGTIVLSRIYDKSYKLETEYAVGVVNVPIRGELLSGDGWYVSTNQKNLEVIVVDGLGHGPLANESACQAIDELKIRSSFRIAEVLNFIHTRLRGGRGAATLLARWDFRKEISYASVGNIRAVTQSIDKMKGMISQNGTAGLTIPTIKEHKQDWNGQGFFILHSDGINNRWDLMTHRDLFSCHPAVVAAFIYRDFNRGTDDSTIVVLGGRSC